MILSDFTIEIANYETDLADLRAVRNAVFVVEQKVPEEIEFDEIDPLCRHVLARDLQGAPIGTGRLTPRHTIGRMAVLPGWRGRGVGEAMLQALVDLARSLGYPVIQLHAQVSAIPFYEKFAFECVGKEFTEAGIVHRTMRRTLDPFPEVSRAALAPRPQSNEVVLDSLHQAHEFALKIIGQARNRLWIYTRDLDIKLYGTPDMLEAIKRFAIASHGGELRILLQDPHAALRDAHPLIPLAQRLPSSILIRVPDFEPDLEYPCAFLIDDRGGFLMRPIGSRYEGAVDLYSPGRQRQLREYFDQVWERSLPCPELRQVHI